MIVLDASATLELLLNTARGADVSQRIEDPAITLHAPHLLDLEVASVLRRYVRHGEILLERADFALEQLALLDIERYDHQALMPRIWELRDNLTTYDAAYVALAEALDAVLLTVDHRMAKAPGIRVESF